MMRKTIQLWITVLVLTIGSSMALTSCSNEDHAVSKPVEQPVILKGQAAVEWTKNHLDSLVNVYMADCGNLLDPDMTRDLLKCIGYTRLNVFDYREAGWLIDSVVFIRLIDRAEAAKQWDYTMTEDLQQKLYAIKQSYIDSGKLTADQIAALQ